MEVVGFPILKVKKKGLVLMKVVREVGEHWLGLVIELLLRRQEPRP